MRPVRLGTRFAPTGARRTARLLAGAATLLSAGCELEELTLVTAEDVVVAEVMVQSLEGAGGAVDVRAFLHRTLGPAGAGFTPVPGARVGIQGQDGRLVELAETEVSRCAETLPEGGDGTCYWAPPEAAGWMRPGERLEVEVLLPGGGALRGATMIPGDFRLAGVPPASACRLAPDTPLELRWSRSEGAWAYVNETVISGLADALAAEGIESDDPLYLLGLSVSSADTSIVFPGEFGVFNRFELEQDLALRLQRGLPGNSQAEITITAADRNYVNWVRGGSFNPSGQVRLPSLRGDGTGVFAAVLVRGLQVRVSAAVDAATPDCPTF
jgi:hypothetical protein